jgi:hypothetical protein
MEKAHADAELTRLERLARAHDRSQQRLTNTARANHATADQLTQQAEVIADTLARRQPTRGDAFVMHLGSTATTNRAEAGQRLKTLIERGLLTGRGPGGPATELATLGGLTLTANPIRGQHAPEVARAFAGVPGDEIRMNLDEIGDADPAGLISRLERRLTGLDQRHTDTLDEAARWRAEANHATEQLGKPFPHAAALTAARTRSREIETAMHTLATEAQPPAPATPSPQPPATSTTPPAGPPRQPSPTAQPAPTLGAPSPLSTTSPGVTVLPEVPRHYNGRR